MSTAKSTEKDNTLSLPAASNRNRILYLIGAVAQGAGPMLTQPFVQRMLPAAEWGKVSFTISLISVGLIFIIAGLPLIITRVFFEEQQGKERAASLAGFGVLLSLAVGAFAAAGVWLVSAVMLATQESFQIVLALAGVGMLGATQMCLALLRARQQAVRFVLITIMAQTIGHVMGLVALLGVLHWAHSRANLNAVTYMCAFALVCAFAMSLAFFWARPSAPFKFRGEIRRALGVSLPILPHSLALVLMLQGEAFILTAVHGPAFYGLYGSMLPMSLGPIAVVLALANVWEPIILSHRGVDSDGAVSRVRREALLVGIALLVAGSVMGGLAAHILTGSPTDEQVLVARILPLTSLGYVVFLLATTQLVAVAKTKTMAVVTPIVAVIDMVSIFAVANSGSLLLVAVVKATFFMLLGLAHGSVARHVDKDLLPLRPIFLAYAAAVVITLASLLLPAEFWPNVFISCAVVAVSGCGFLVLRAKKK